MHRGKGNSRAVLSLVKPLSPSQPSRKQDVMRTSYNTRQISAPPLYSQSHFLLSYLGICRVQSAIGAALTKRMEDRGWAAIARDLVCANQLPRHSPPTTRKSQHD